MHEHVLTGLDAANPLAFLAALGTIRIVSLQAQPARPRLSWRVSDGAWRPCLHTASPGTPSQLADEVFAACSVNYSIDALALADDLAVPSEAYRRYAETAAGRTVRGEFVHAEFAACFASDILTTDNGIVQDTALRTMSGAGHQHFLRTMRNLVADTRAQHVNKALFSRWQYDDPVRNMTLRWDPNDDSRYALRWSDPSGDPERARAGAMWGANRLALEGLPLLPVMPGERQLETTGFRTAGGKGTFWTWPIWTCPIDLDTIRSVLAMKELQTEPVDRVQLAKRGIEEVFRSQRLTTGKFRNFTRGVPVTSNRTPVHGLQREVGAA